MKNIIKKLTDGIIFCLGCVLGFVFVFSSILKLFLSVRSHIIKDIAMALEALRKMAVKILQNAIKPISNVITIAGGFYNAVD